VHSAAAVLLCALGAVACSPASPAPPSPTADASPSQLEQGDWGPLAVIDFPAGDTDLAALGGPLEISETCVVVSGYTLIWRNSQTQWDPERRAILFHEVFQGDEVVALADGDDVRLGGGEVFGELPWVAQPDPSCPTDLFGVGTLTSVNGIRVGE